MIIDFRFSPPTPEGLGRYLEPPRYMHGYAATYGAQVYGTGSRARNMTAEELIRFLDEQGVDKVVFKTGDTETIRGKKYPLEKLYKYVHGYQDRLLALAGVDPHKGMSAVRVLEAAGRDYGFCGANIFPLQP